MISKLETFFPNLENGWKSFYPNIYQEPIIYKNPFGEVKLEGLINGDWTKKIFTLPPGCKPGKRLIFTVYGIKSYPYRLDILENGDVYLSVDGSLGVQGSGWISLTGVSFYSKH